MAKWTGQQAAGSREYSEADARAVVALLIQHCTGPSCAMSAEDFAAAYTGALGARGGSGARGGLGLSPRATRAILSDRDGIDFLLANEGNGLMYVCELADDGEATTRKLAARAQTELRRVARRREFAARLLRRQGMLAI